jgi:glutamyl-tRNA synthetase
MNDIIKTRFAPSPTGNLHIGGARTAIISWLIAQKLDGSFALRIEDTDTVRSKPEYTSSIMNSLQWLDINHDEGPVYQTECYDHYREVAYDLVSKGLAYYCYATQDELAAQRQEYKDLNGHDGWKYDRKWRDSTETPPAGVNPTIRLKAPIDGVVLWKDLTKGEITIPNSQLDDFIILRSDGSPTYNFCVVVDDSDMDISHVIRGDDHINNTPKQIHIYNALGKEIPVFGHIPLILNIDGSKQSKSSGSTSVNYYRDLGILPEAITNYLLLISCNDLGKEIFTKEEFVELFQLDKLGANPIKFDLEKLLWINGEYIKKLSKPEFLRYALTQISDKEDMATVTYLNGLAQKPWEYVMPGIFERSKTINDFKDLIAPMLNWNVEGLQQPVVKEALESLLTNQSVLDNFTPTVIHDELKLWTEKKGLKFGELMKPLRSSLFPDMKLPIAEVLAFIGSDILINGLVPTRKSSLKM